MMVSWVVPHRMEASDPPLPPSRVAVSLRGETSVGGQLLLARSCFSPTRVAPAAKRPGDADDLRAHLEEARGTHADEAPAGGAGRMGYAIAQGQDSL